MANPTAPSQWKKNTAEEVKLPSGNVALIKRPGMEKLFAAGVLPDELTKIALESIDTAEKGKPTDHLPKGGAKPQELDPDMLRKFMETEGAIEGIFSSFDRICEMVVVEPPVKWHMRKVTDANGHWVRDSNEKPQYEEIPANERDEENFVYTDDVDIDDKTFIFNFVVGGTRDVETFRSEYSDALADVQSREDVGLPPE